MNFLDNEFAVPVICGGGGQAAKVLAHILSTPVRKPHIFSDRFSVKERLFAVCHRLPSFHPHIVCSAVCDFAYMTDESITPLFILYNSETVRFWNQYKDKLEPLFINVDLTDIHHNKTDCE